jgi:hypothetical protein
MRPQQGKSKRRRVESVVASDHLKWRSIREFVALMRSDLVAGRALMLGDILSSPRIGCERRRCAESHDDYD